MPSRPPQLKSNSSLEVIRAGAGSGKTTALITKLINSIDSYYSLNKKFPRIAVSTFTRKAAGEIKERLLLRAMSSPDPKLIQYINNSPLLQISTLHGIFNTFLQLYGHYIDLSPGFTIMEADEEQKLFETVLKEQVFEKQQGAELLKHYQFHEIRQIVLNCLQHIQYQPHSRPANLTELKTAWQESMQKTENNETLSESKKTKALDQLKQELALLPEFISVFESLEALARRVSSSLMQKKKELARASFNDLELMTLEALQTKPIKKSFYDFWFLDEYQDTSLIQDEILNYLTKDSQVFIVGDPQQSIYYFRGACSSVFLNKEKQQNQKGERLSCNYRSSSALIDFFNVFFNNSLHFSKFFEKMQSSGKTFKECEEAVKFIPYKDDISETAEKRIQQLLKRNIHTKDIAVLSQKNKTLFKLAQYLKQKQVPAQVCSAGHFKSKREIKDGFFLLKFLLNPHDDENLIGLLRTPYCRTPDAELSSWMQEKNKLSLWSFCLKQQTKLLEEQRSIQKLKSLLAQSGKEGITCVFQKALESLGLLDLSYYQDPTGLWEAHLWKMIYLLREYELKGSSSLLAFANQSFNIFANSDYKSSSTETGSGSPQPALESLGLQLMTIHQAKGLEFEHIILLDDFSASEKQVGHRGGEFFSAHRESGKWALKCRSKQEDKRISSQFQQKILEWNNLELSSEIDRLIYVALTRAKQSLSVIYSEQPSLLSKHFPYKPQAKPSPRKSKADCNT